MPLEIISIMPSPGFEEVLQAHAARYPLMRPADAVKLVYQNEFGGGHIITDEASSLARLKDEYAQLHRDNAPLLIEEIGNGLVRLHLSGIPEGSVAAVNTIFMRSAEIIKGDQPEFIQKLDLPKRLALEGRMPFTSAEFDKELADCREAGYPMARHSQPYREAYAPAYRVVHKKYADFLPLVFLIDRVKAEKGSAVIAIDGNSGSGKTTLAALLKTVYDCPIVSMDDFFLPPDLRTEARLSEPGGNIHYERFAREVLPGLISGNGFKYSVFDCSRMEYNGIIKIPPARLTVVEGSYSLHPRFCGAVDIRVFLACGGDAQLRRLRERVDEKLYQQFVSVWIPMEEKYHTAFNIREQCDLLFDTQHIDKNS